MEKMKEKKNNELSQLWELIEKKHEIKNIL